VGQLSRAQSPELELHIKDNAPWGPTAPGRRDLHWLSNRYLETSVLATSADSLIGYLRGHGYNAFTIRHHVRSVCHFAYWLTKHRIQLPRVDEELVHQFVTKHLPACDCPGLCQHGPHGVHAALRHLLPILREEGRIPPARIEFPPTVHNELQRYDSYLAEICGLAPATREYRLPWVGRFMVHCFGDDPVDLSRIGPREVVDFMAQPNKNYKPGTMAVIAAAVRSYLRYRSLSCADDVQKLLAAVPSTACWSLAALPKHLTSDEVTRFFGTFNQRTVAGLRGYAMARCLLDMGLRASEVAAIQLDDLNWPEGTFTIRRGKSRRADTLPLPVPTGRAIVRYIRKARPKSESRALFLRHMAPLDLPINAAFVRGHIQRAFAACGLSERFTGTHVLRHTAAVRMRCAGASLKEIADVLRHRNLNTTMIYTKVDLPKLAELAAPWPGGQL
jgi:integrase/recombinase XerD